MVMADIYTANRIMSGQDFGNMEQKATTTRTQPVETKNRTWDD